MLEKISILPQNEHIHKQLRDRGVIFRDDPSKINQLYLRPCQVKVLLVTDGALDFGMGDFGLSTFVSILQNDGRSYVRFNITLAHRSGFVSDAAVQVGAANIARSIKAFRFDNAGHFSESMYDQVWLFGFDSTPNGMSKAELTALSNFMNKGGGLFATGDHGSLGQSLCGDVTRVRSMRLWADTPAGEVSMGGVKRNDTNRRGDDGNWQFDDQSDDTPQTIQPKLYTSQLGVFWKETYPHPLLCSPTGRITVLPDHPHEGECRVPANLNLTYLDGTPEFPGGISPEVIATSTVAAGNGDGSIKQFTQAHSFGAICAYDGHRANVGRVVTDATWHHFVNVNLVGEVLEPQANEKGMGFLFSVSGQQHLEKIKHYYINIAVWISRPSNISCFNGPIIWNLLYHHRVIEAASDNPNLRLDQVSLVSLYLIGSHARDVLGRITTPCRKLRFLLDIIRIPLPEFAPIIDPWIPNLQQDPDSPLPWFDVNPLFSVALGAGLVAVREKFKDIDKVPDEKMQKLILPEFEEGSKRGVDVAVKSFQNNLGKHMRSFFESSNKAKTNGED